MSRAEMDYLLDFVIPFAKDQLEKRGEFYPYAAAVKADGKGEAFMGHPGQEDPSNRDMVNFLARGLRESAQSKGYRATAICFMARTRADGEHQSHDAIGVFLEHGDGEAVEVYLPYERLEDGVYRYLDSVASGADPTILTHKSSTDRPGIVSQLRRWLRGGGWLRHR